MKHLQYPIGEFEFKPERSSALIKSYLERYSTLPQRLSDLVAQFEEHKWQDSYRPGGWNAIQVVHHIADSHINSYCRVKWALSEPESHTKTYEEKIWAQMPDANDTDFSNSLMILKGVHAKLTQVFESLNEEDWDKGLTHPDWDRLSVYAFLQLYAWHGDHHLAHLNLIANQK